MPPLIVHAVVFAPTHAHTDAAHAWRPLCGGPITGVHVPTLPVRLQASHEPPQAVLQQTPSTQLPLSH